MSGDYVLIYEKKQQFLCSIRNRICRAFLLPITCGHYIAECHLPTFYAHIISVIMCKKYFCARCIAECAILPRHCEYQEKLFGKTPSRFYSKTNQSSLLSLCVHAQWRFEGGVSSSNQYCLSYYPRDAFVSLTLKCLLLPCICL